MMSDKSVCYGCPRRTSICRGKCPDWAKEKAKEAAKKAVISQKRKEEQDVNGVLYFNNVGRKLIEKQQKKRRWY